MAEPFIGEIILFSGAYAMRDYARCDGALLSVSGYEGLFSMLGTAYGGDGRSTFALPDMRGRTPVHENGDGAHGLPHRKIGQASGTNLAHLETGNLPSHEHSFFPPASRAPADSRSPGSSYYALNQTNIYSGTANTHMRGHITLAVGEGMKFSIQNPFLCMNYLIALNGAFPID